MNAVLNEVTSQMIKLDTPTHWSLFHVHTDVTWATFHRITTRFLWCGRNTKWSPPRRLCKSSGCLNRFEVCSANIAEESYRTNWISESDNRRKGEYISYEHYIHSALIKKTFSFLSSWLSPERNDCNALWRMHASNNQYSC